MITEPYPFSFSRRPGKYHRLIAVFNIGEAVRNLPVDKRPEDCFCIGVWKAKEGNTRQVFEELGVENFAITNGWIPSTEANKDVKALPTIEDVKKSIAATKKLWEGTEARQMCNREGCTGIIEERESNLGGCSCHINPPCYYCTEGRTYCPECDWQAENA